MKFKRRFSEAERTDLLDKSQKCLWMEEGKLGLYYLLHERSLKENIIRDFGLGFIPHNVKHQLAGRIIMPLYDASGNLVVLTSRLINQYHSKLPVYWHEHYEKSFYLFGIDHAKKYIRKWRFAVLVEGQVDVLQLHNHGLSNTVGLCGSTLNEVQLSLIYRYCDEIVLILDTDENKVGQKATAKIMQKTLYKNKLMKDTTGEILNLFQMRHKIVPVELPSGDPDEYVKQHGIRALKSLIKPRLLNTRRSEYVG